MLINNSWKTNTVKQHLTVILTKLMMTMYVSLYNTCWTEAIQKTSNNNAIGKTHKTATAVLSQRTRNLRSLK